MENERANVLFLREISPAGVVRLFNAFGKELKGKVAVKVHSGEAGNQNFLRPEFWRNIVERVGGRICGRAAILAEGDAKGRTDINYLAYLPLFDTEGNPL